MMPIQQSGRSDDNLNDNEQVAEANDEQRCKESQGGGVEDEGGRPNILWLRPNHVAGIKFLLKNMFFKKRKTEIKAQVQAFFPTEM